MFNLQNFLRSETDHSKGFLHPIIHLGFGIEFQQPAIIAEALAQAAVHDNWIGPLFIGAEKAARSQSSPVSKSLLTLLAEVRRDPTLLASPHWKDANKIRDGILQRAPSEMIHYASQYTVSATSLTRAIAEMTNFAIYYTGAAQRPQKAVKFDFYFMHCVNSSIFFSVFAKQSWLSAANKVRLLEWKGRNDLVMYVSRHSPELRLDEITEYKPEQPATGEAAWDAIVKRVRKHNEDGHAAKLLRAIAHGQAICQPYEAEDDFKVKGDMWLQLAHMGEYSLLRLEHSSGPSRYPTRNWESG